MDRRTLLAMGLLFLLFMTWSKVYTHFYGPDPSAADSTAAVSAVETADLPTTGEDPVAPSREAVPAPAHAEPVADPNETHADDSAPGALDFLPGPDGELVVTTDLYRMVVDLRGGVVTSWRGLEFPGVDEEHVELVPVRGELSPRPRGDVLTFAAGELDLTETAFRLSGPDVLLLAAGDRPRTVELTAETNGGVTVRKSLTFHPGRYAVDVDYRVDGSDELLRRRLGDPVSARFVWDRGIAETEVSLQVMMRGPTQIRSYAMVGDELSFRNQGDLERDDAKAFGAFRGSVRFAGVQSKYFAVAGLVPDSVEQAVEGRIRLGGDRETLHQSWELELPLRPAGASLGAGCSLYFGPNDFDRLGSYGAAMEQTVNLGWKWIQPISELVLRLMNWLHGFIPNYGWVIVVISILSKLIFWPLTARGTKAMRKTAESQARLKPMMDELKRKYGKDQQRYNQEMMELYKREGVNPMAGMAGCMPMLIQMPVFFALYQVLYNMVDLRMAPWMLWINDLSQPDALFTMPFSLPLLGASFNLLPLLMAAVTFLQTKLTPQPAGGNQMAAMNNIMPIMMLFFLYNMPSGLVIYWTINTAMTALQSWMVNRNAPATGGASAA